MRTLLRKVGRDLQRRPLRNVLTLLGIVLGVAGVVTISSTARTVADAQRLTYASSRQADLATFTGDMSPTTSSLIERQPNVAVAETRAVAFTRFTSGGDWQNLRLVGVASFDTLRLDVVELVEGRAPGRGEIAFDTSVTELTPVALGDVVAVRNSPADPTTYLTVVGFTRSPATLGAGILNRATAYAAPEAVRTLTGRKGDNFLLVRVNDPARAAQTADDITRLLAKRGVNAGAFDVRDPNVFVGSRELGTLLLLLRIFSWLGASLASVLVANTLAAVMGEETTQIGIIKSLGGSRRHILLTYLAYGAALGIAGAVIGWLVGAYTGRALSGYLTGLTGLQQPGFRLAPREIGLALLVGTLVSLAASLVPVWVKSRSRAALLLHSPGVRSEFRRPLLGRLAAPLGRLNATLALGVRNVLRRPARTLSTIVVVAVAVAAFVATQALSRSVSSTVDELYALYGADAWVFFERPVDLGYARTLELEPTVAQAEPWTSAQGNIGATRTDIWGMPDTTPLYAYRLVAGAWFAPSNPPSVVVTTNLAAALGVRVGDVRVLDVGQRRETVRISGIVNDSSTYLGNAATGKLFMRVSDINRLRGLGTRADLFALKLRSSDPAAVRIQLDTLEARLRGQGPVTFAAYSDQQGTQRAISVLTLMLNAMVIVVAVVGVAGIANTLLINIAERRREFGVLRAVGGGARHALIVLVSEGVTLATIGLIAGVIAGYPLARLIVNLTSAQLFDLTFHLSAESLALTFAVALLAVAGVSALPGLVAARIPPIQALRYE